MNRILFSREEVSADGTTVFDDARAVHVLHILHGQVGQRLKTGVVDGLTGHGTITEIVPYAPDPQTGTPRGRITLACRHDTPSLEPWIDLVLAPPRPRALKRLLPQLASLGVGRIVLVGAEKVEKAFWGAQLLKPEVYRPLFVEGLMQAGTTACPVLDVEKSFARYLQSARFDEAFAASRRLVAHPGERCDALSPRGDGERIVLAVGPEGGWTAQEVALLEEKGFRTLSLGRRILRTDTALIALIARLM